ncbi:hypothetical protein MTO96_037766 [Rhipicephalus appendiculatus]
MSDGSLTVSSLTRYTGCGHYRSPALCSSSSIAAVHGAGTTLPDPRILLFFSFLWKHIFSLRMSVPFSPVPESIALRTPVAEEKPVHRKARRVLAAGAAPSHSRRARQLQSVAGSLTVRARSLRGRSAWISLRCPWPLPLACCDECAAATASATAAFTTSLR